MLRAFLVPLLVMPVVAMDLDRAVRVVRGYNFRAVRMAVEDLAGTFGAEYPGADGYLRRSCASPGLRLRSPGLRCRLRPMIDDSWAARPMALTQEDASGARRPPGSRPSDTV